MVKNDLSIPKIVLKTAKKCQKWCKTQKKDKKILVIATHTDVPHEKKKAEQYCADILQPLKEFRFVKGSLKNYKSALDLFNETKEMVEE